MLYYGTQEFSCIHTIASDMRCSIPTTPSVARLAPEWSYYLGTLGFFADLYLCKPYHIAIVDAKVYSKPTET